MQKYLQLNSVYLYCVSEFKLVFFIDELSFLIIVSL